MMYGTKRIPRAQLGMVLILALVLLATFAVLAASFAPGIGLNLRSAANRHLVLDARLAAESGLTFMSYLLPQVDLPLVGDGQVILAATAKHLSDQLDGSVTLQGASIEYDGTTITIPKIPTGNRNASFTTLLRMSDPNTVYVRVTGTAHEVARSLGIDFSLNGGHPVFGYGIASKGPICLENNITFLGANTPEEASLLSIASGTAFRLEGGLTVEGDVYAASSEANVIISGTGTIGGAPMDDPSVMDHVHLGEGFADFPVIDTSLFEPFATSPVHGTTVTNGTKTFNNIRIDANTNPTFQGDIAINGVVFIETPNRVTFGNGTTITGVIVTQQASQVGPGNEIRFQYDTRSYGVEDLPDTVMFAEIRTMPGSFILAPGFRVKFENDSGVINGIVAAEHVKFENTFNGTLCGGIICYGSEEIMAEDFSSFTIDHSKYPLTPAGFVVEQRRLVGEPASYREY